MHATAQHEEDEQTRDGFYEGIRTDHGTPMILDQPDGTDLDPRRDPINHSPSGLEWGYLGSGPAQAALAIMADLFDDGYADRYHQRFARDFVADLPADEWAKTKEAIRLFCIDHYGDPETDDGR
jgi:hypothetical protein